MSRRNILVAALVAVLLIVVWFFFVVSPRRGEVSDIESQIDTAEITAQGLRGEKAALLAIRDSELSYQRATAELERSIPMTPNLAEFIEDFNLLADETGVDVIALSPALPVAIEDVPFQTLDISTTIEGQFFEVLGFLYGLEDLERLVRIDGVSLSASPTELGPTLITAALTGRIFTLAVDLPTPGLEPLPPADDGTTTTTTIAGDTTTTTTTTTVADNTGGTP